MLHELLLSNIERQPHATAIVTPERLWSYAEIAALSVDCIRLIQQVGAIQGDRIGLLMANSPLAVAAYFGALLTGSVVVPLDMRNPVDVLARQLVACETTTVISETRHRALLTRLAAVIGPSLRIVTLAEPLPATRSLRPADCQNAASDPDAPAVIFLTSGSTGTAKGVVLSHKAILANTQAIVTSLSLDNNDRVMQVLPLSYCYGASLLHTHFSVGGSLVLDHRISYPAKVVEQMRLSACTGFAAVPSILHTLARYASLHSAVPTLRYVTCAGGALDSALEETLRQSLQPAVLYIMYGLTEASARLTCLDPKRWQDKRGSVGQAIAGIELSIKRADGSTAASGESGEICAAGTSIMSAYVNDPIATASAVANGWLHTGDLGYLDAEGFLYITGRSHDFIKTRGYRVSPVDISNVFLRHPEVTQALTVGVPDLELGERIGTLICLRAGSRIVSQELMRYGRTQLPQHLRPAQIKIVAELPLLVNGKIDRTRAQGLLLEEPN